MTQNSVNGYVLVKDKDGNLKYYKDGKFYNIEEVEKQSPAKSVARPEAKMSLKPVMTFDSANTHSLEKTTQPTVKLAAKKPVQSAVETVEKKTAFVSPAVRPVVNSIRKIEPAAPAVKPVISAKADIDLEELVKDAELHSRRSEDQTIIDGRVNEVIAKLKIKFSDEQIEKRFRNILATFFRGIRASKEMAYILGLPKLSGGLELPADKVSLIVSVLEHEADAIAKERRNVAVKPKEKLTIGKEVDLGHRLQPPAPMTVPAVKENLTPAADIKPVQPVSPRPSVPPVRTVPPVVPIVQRPKTSPAVELKPKPKIDEIKLNRRLIGPVEELQIMDLKGFRELGKNVDEIKEAIMEKMQVLKEQSLLNKIKGQQAWKKSPVFQLYLIMTFQAIKGKKQISEVIRQRQIDNQEVLTLSEYEMIAGLNRKIEE